MVIKLTQTKEEIFAEHRGAESSLIFTIEIDSVVIDLKAIKACSFKCRTELA